MPGRKWSLTAWVGIIFFLAAGAFVFLGVMTYWHERSKSNWTTSKQAMAFGYGGAAEWKHNYVEAFNWYRQAPEYSLTQERIGYYYQNGWAVKQDYNEAMKWYKASAAQGYDLAKMEMEALAKLMNPELPASAKEAFERGRDAYGLQNYDGARRWITMAAQQGYAPAEVYMGHFYTLGRGGITRDPERAYQWYLKAARHGDVEAEYRVGQAYEEGRGVPQDYVAANTWFLKAATHKTTEGTGNVDAQNSLGWNFSNGLGVRKDYDRAMEWYKKAEAMGPNSRAEFQISWLYLNREKPDRVEAFKWLRRAADHGSDYARLQFAMLYEYSKEYKKALFYYQTVLANSEFIEQELYYQVSRPGNWLNTEQLWCACVASTISADAMYGIGHLHAIGAGVPLNMVKAREWMVKSAQKGNESAAKWLHEHPVVSQ